MILYLDTSALVKLYIQETGSDIVQIAVQNASHVAISRVAYPEARSAFARRCLAGDISKPDLKRIIFSLNQDSHALVWIELTASLAKYAGELAEHHGLRGFDSIHIASALECGRLINQPPNFLTFDDRQAVVAKAEGLFVVHNKN